MRMSSKYTTKNFPMKDCSTWVITHKNTLSIWQAKRHGHPLIQPIIRLEGCLPFISRADSNLVITTLQIILWEDCGTEHHVKHVIHSENWKMVFHCYLVDSMAIHTHSPWSIFLWRQQSGTAQGLKLSYDPLLNNSPTCFFSLACSIGFIW